MSNDNAPSVSQTLGDAGACPEVTLGDKVWRFGWPTQRAKTELEKLALAKATDSVVLARADVSPVAYAELMGDLRRGVSAGDYKTFGAGWSAVVNGPDGSVLFLLALLREKHPEANEQTARDLMQQCPDETSIALLQVAPPFCRLLCESLPVAKEQQQAAAARMAEGFARRTTSSPTSAS